MSESPEQRRAGGSPPGKVLCVPVGVRGPRAAGRIPPGQRALRGPSQERPRGKCVGQTEEGPVGPVLRERTAGWRHAATASTVRAEPRGAQQPTSSCFSFAVSTELSWKQRHRHRKEKARGSPGPGRDQPHGPWEPTVTASGRAGKSALRNLHQRHEDPYGVHGNRGWEEAGAPPAALPTLRPRSPAPRHPALPRTVGSRSPLPVRGCHRGKGELPVTPPLTAMSC